MRAKGIAILGLGNHAINRILPAIEFSNFIDLIGVCSRNATTVNSCSKTLSCIGWTDHHKMLENPNVDIVYISTPISTHFDFAYQALKAGKHVWCEKPLCCSFSNVQDLVNVAQENNKMLAESFMYLYHPQFEDVKRYSTNKLRSVHSISSKFGIPNLENPGFRNSPELCGGAFWDVGSYPISVMISLYPESNVKVLFAEIIKKKNNLVDSEGRAILRFSNDTSAYIEWGVGMGYKNEIEIWSNEGSLYTDKIFSKPVDYQPIFKIQDKQGNTTIKYGKISDQFVEMFKTFNSMLDSPDRIVNEYKLIVKRARVMDEIIKYTNLTSQ
jgi:dTDP-3,4-didehydro-2,6-dideoxy-alpha-D-glucose 3-reductase